MNDNAPPRASRLGYLTAIDDDSAGDEHAAARST